LQAGAGNSARGNRIAAMPGRRESTMKALHSVSDIIQEITEISVTEIAVDKVRHEMSAPAAHDYPAPPIDIFMHAMLNTCLFVIERDGRDLTVRQLAGFLIIYTAEKPYTVHGLAAHLNVPAPSIRCIMDRLTQLGLIVCERNPQDRRSLLVHRTPAGSDFFRELSAPETVMRLLTKPAPVATPTA
jgi:DNA-binding MarR family transcriptional regulator